MTAALEIQGVSVVRAGSRVVRDVSITAPAGEVTVIVGPNGAGKTSLLEAVSGIIAPSAGEIHIGAQSLAGLSRVQRAERGLTHVEQGRTIFGQLTVEENLRVVGEPEEAWDLFPQLRERSTAKASSLSGGEQQMLVIARALLREPEVLLIDEVSQGLAPVIVQRIVPALREAADRGIAILLVEQFVSLALEVGDHAFVMAHGEIVFSADCEELSQDPSLLTAAYMEG